MWVFLVYDDWLITSQYTKTRNEQKNFTTGFSPVLCYHCNAFCIGSFINIDNLLGMNIFTAIPFFVLSCLMIMKSKLSISLCFHELLFHLRLVDSSDLCLQFLSLAL